MSGHECYHCRQWIAEGEAHDCWTTTEQALTADLSDDLRDAWDRLRETAADFGDQRIYASGSCIMFSRTSCYFFVRPRRNALELCVFLGKTVKAAQVRRAVPSSRLKIAHTVHVRHRDEVEAPLTDWLREAYEVSDTLTARGRTTRASTQKVTQGRPSKKAAVRTRTARAKGRHVKIAEAKPARRKR